MSENNLITPYDVYMTLEQVLIPLNLVETRGKQNHFNLGGAIDMIEKLRDKLKENLTQQPAESAETQAEKTE